ncbi:hypothetical protein Glove_505g15 [Diversispora epigaea]|uniref:Uncharacterized protein n=1 Tax=Diversispora epigaea TaxID=1348612 RepID=A0A397GGQ1_9GLOM|nr:hypothetical protein Glove_505g15 [Diversispora epigaea]
MPAPQNNVPRIFLHELMLAAKNEKKDDSFFYLRIVIEVTNSSKICSQFPYLRNQKKKTLIYCDESK